MPEYQPTEHGASRNPVICSPRRMIIDGDRMTHDSSAAAAIKVGMSYPPGTPLPLDRSVTQRAARRNTPFFGLLTASLNFVASALAVHNVYVRASATTATSRCDQLEAETVSCRRGQPL